MIPTRRRLQYASGFIELGMLDAAAAELDGIAPADAGSIAVRAMRLDLLMARKDWAALVPAAQHLVQLDPTEEKGWIFQAYALRELSRIAEAQDVLHAAENLGLGCGVLHYNLACYACLLGDKVEARRRLAQAAALDKSWLDSALEDPDLAAMREEIRAGKATR